MDARKKLIEILKQAPFEGKVLDEWWFEEKIKRIADHLINNGVTVQKWISVEDKLPPYNHNVLVYRPNMAMEILVDNYSGYYGEDDDEWHEGWALYGEDAYGNPVITHWAYFPQPPKGE